ncbi:methylenetetrahydrofolate reductase [Ornithinimicrobium avium]|uniref:Methylenetetrahydrofolate reductase n=1 Tax=Ornithinimicrobium avium TaxID=2283195 RepID=A0A345NR07_9MICO|nr:methylenetetrahydrofolate reductase [Ornithinimicrobium avium]AXH97465.1 5,10-methylenetetrahydrofolate reductase [Ornithinimicrobium avium]
MSGAVDLAVRRLLEGARYEVLPTASIHDQVLEHVPTSVTVSVTASPGKRLGATLDLSASLATAGYDVVPHLAARMVSGRAELVDIVEQLRELGVRRVFVPAGDAQVPVGDYVQALDLLHDLRDMGDPFPEVSITGYPEAHPFIEDDVVVQAMWDKRLHATHVVSNMTFDPEILAAWVHRIRRRGVNLPLLAGVPGPVERTKLLAMGTKIGVGDSLRFLRKQRKVMTRVVGSGFSTDRFVTSVAGLAADPAMGVAGLHVYTFNQVGVVEAWRRAALSHEARGAHGRSAARG